MGVEDQPIRSSARGGVASSAVDGLHRTGVAAWFRFVGECLRSPLAVGAIVPSSRLLTETILAGCNLAACETVVELGPGSGTFTRHILERIGKATTFLAIELNVANAAVLRKRFPQLAVYNDSAAQIQRCLAQHGKQRADCIISGLPWGNFSIATQNPIIDAVFSAVAPAGMFTTFAYLHAGWYPTTKNFRRRMRNRFDAIEATPVIWRNIPPAFVFRCRKPTL
jgi:phospholipid N-methyltransferase